jgi:hypothetical protein
MAVVRPRPVVADSPPPLRQDYTNPLDPIRTYDISPDGQRFLLIKQDRSAPQSTAASDGLVVVLNWAEELERLRLLK